MTRVKSTYRMSGEKLKSTKSEIAALDEQLAQADAQRKQLQSEVAARRAKKKTDSLEVDSLPLKSPH